MPALTGPQTVLAFKAGRAFRRGETNFVDASPEKGALLIEREDEMLHLVWKNRETGSSEEVYMTIVLSSHVLALKN